MPTPTESRPPNPRGDRRGRPPAPSEPATVRGVWLFLGLLALLAVGQFLLMPPGSRSVSYSEFLEMVRGGRVTEVVVGADEIRGAASEPEGGSQWFTVVPVDDPGLLDELEANGVEVTGRISSNWGPTLMLWVVPIVVLALFWGVLLRRLGGAQGGAMAFGKSKARIYAEDDVKVSFADVAGVDEAEEELLQIIDFLREPGKYTRLGGHIPKGVLLVGPPGTGKTLLARAVAGEARVPFFSLSGSEFVEMFVGVGAARVRDLFTQAERRAPCIVFIDELDALGKLRTVGPTGTHEEREQTLNQLLAEMDGFDSRKGVIILAATNRPEVLDPALLRPGRFDRQVLVDKPDVRGREAILRLHTKAVQVDPTVDLDAVAARTAGFAGADLANLVNEAALLAARHDRDAVGPAEIEEAIDRLVAGLEKKRVMSDQERKIIAFHEVGHAILASVLPGSDPVQKISIVQRGFGALGYTLQVPLEDRYLLTRTELRHRLAVLLGGRAAEEVVFDEVSTGAENDLSQATELARSMVTQLGMGSTLGVMSVARPDTEFLPGSADRRGGLAERTAERIDDEVKAMLDEAHETALSVLTERRPALSRVADRLLAAEVLEGDELRELLAEDDEDGAQETPGTVRAFKRAEGS